MKNRLITLLKNNYLLVLLISLSGCDYLERITGEGEQEGEVVAQCFDKKLYKKDIEQIPSKHLSPEDSSARVKTYINNWINKKTFTHFADNDTLVDHDSIEKKVKEFEDQLKHHALKKALVKHHLDTSITQEEVKAYYEEHKDNYVLQRIAVKAIYFRIYKEQKSLPEVEKWLHATTEASLDSAVKHGKSVAQEHNTDYSSWHYWKNIAQNTPLENISDDELVSENKVIKESDENTVYYVKLLEVAEKGQRHPLSLASPLIKRQIIAERKQNLLEKHKESYLKKAHEKDAIKIHY